MTSTVTEELKTQSSDNEVQVLLNTFTVRRRPYSVLLHDGQLVWQRERSTTTAKKSDPTIIPLSDLISVDHPTLTNNHQPASFIIHYAQRQHRRRITTDAFQPSNIWRVHRRRFLHAEQRIVRLWLDTLRRHLSPVVQPQRPRHLLVFVNPFGGRRNALRIYEKVVKPLFELAHIEADVVVSQRPNQIGDMLQRHLLLGLDGVVCVGGDGTVSEVFNGLVKRAMTDRRAENEEDEKKGGDGAFARPRLPVGIIPGGSTDTIAYCLHGTTDVQTAVIHIVLGQRTGLDLASVRKAKNGELLRLYASVMSYGYLGDVAADSERYRWMGPRRYDYSGFKKFVVNRAYEGEIHIPEDDDNDVDAIDGQPDDGLLCCEQCPRCGAQSQLERHQAAVISDNDGKSKPITTSTKWRVLRGKFFMVNGANLSCACERSPNGFSRYGHIGDGRLDLVLVRHTPMLNNLRLLRKLTSRTQRISELPFVEIYRVRSFRFRRADAAALATDDDVLTNALNASTERVLSERSQQQRNVVVDGSGTEIETPDEGNGAVVGSQWNCDGEVITEADVDVESHCQLVTVFRRGPAMPRAPSEGDTRCPCGF